MVTGVIEKFIDWVNEIPDGKKDDFHNNFSKWEKLGLKPEAPEEAKEAFARFLEIRRRERETRDRIF